MKKILYIYSFILLLFSALTAGAQEKSIILSLNDAVELGLKNNPDYAIKNIQILENRQKLKKEISSKFPDITLEGGFQRNFIIGATPIPAKIMFPEADEKDVYPAHFGTDYSGAGGINFNYDIFNPDHFGNVDLQKIRTSMAEVDLDIEKEKLIANICLDYAAVILAEEQLSLCKIDTLYSVQLLEYADNRHNDGQISKEDLLSAKQDYNLSHTRMIEAENVLSKARIKLLSDIGLSSSEINILALSDNIESLIEKAEEIDIENDNSNITIKENLELKMKETEARNTGLMLIPKFSIVGYYGSSYYYNGFDIFNKNHWYGNCYLGLKITYPLTALFGKAYQWNDSKLQYSETQIQIRKNQINRYNEIASFTNEIESNKKEMKLRKENLQLAMQKYETMVARSEEGQIYPAQLTSALFETREARVEWLNCQYDYFTAIANKRLTSIK